MLLVIAILHHGYKSLFSVFTFDEEHLCSAFASYLLFFFPKKEEESLVLGELCQYNNFFWPKSYSSMMKLLQSMT